MTKTRRAAVLAAIAVLIGSAARAQGVVLAPAEPRQWDVAGQIGWFGGNKSDVGPEWDEWYESASGGVTIGRHLTRHLEIELDVTTTSEGDVFSEERLAVPGQTTLLFRIENHYFQATSLGGGLTYQFFENQWFHPFLGIGIDGVRESERIEIPFQYVPPSSVGARAPVPVPQTGKTVSYAARPFATAGFKWYVSERAFVRSDVRMSTWGNHPGSLNWRAGVGVDF